MLNLTRSTWGRYALAVVAVAVALLITFALLPFSRNIPFAFFFAAVVVATLYGGLRPGLLAIVLSVLASGTFILSPAYSLNLRLEGWLQLSVFLGVSFTIAFLTERGRQAESDLLLSERRFRQLADNIDQVFWVYDLNEARIVYANPRRRGATRGKISTRTSALSSPTSTRTTASA